MTQEEKELLLKDLCARARYRVKIYVPKGTRININGKIKEKDLVDTVYGVIFYNDEPRIVTPQNFSFLDKNGINNFGGWTVEMVKPYLRPMSSMTESEYVSFSNILHKWFDDELFTLTEEPFIEYALSVIGYSVNPILFDWLNVHHFDYRGLIPMGLALEAPEGMYKTE